MQRPLVEERVLEPGGNVFLPGAVQHDGDEAPVVAMLVVLLDHQLVDVLRVQLSVRQRLFHLRLFPLSLVQVILRNANQNKVRLKQSTSQYIRIKFT